MNQHKICRDCHQLFTPIDQESPCYVEMRCRECQVQYRLNEAKDKHESSLSK